MSFAGVHGGPDAFESDNEDEALTPGGPQPLDLTDHKFLPSGAADSSIQAGGSTGGYGSGRLSAIEGAAAGASSGGGARVDRPAALMPDARTAAERAGLKDPLHVPQRPTPDAPQQQVLFAEFMGTFFLVFICSACVFVGSIMTYDALTTDKILYVSLGYGLMHGLLVYTLSFPYQWDDMMWEHTRHMNPAITLCLLLLGRMHISRAWKYWVVQLLGAMAATFVLFCCTPPIPMGSMETVTSTKWYQSLVMSLVQSSTVLIVLLTTTFTVPNARVIEIGDGLESHAQTETEIRITVCSLIIICCSYTFSVSGGFMHPFITLAVAVLSGRVSIASFFGPFIASFIVVGILYVYGLCQRSRTVADVYRVPMIMKKIAGTNSYVLDSEADALAQERALGLSGGADAGDGTPRARHGGGGGGRHHNRR